MNLVIDTSAVVVCLTGEAERLAFVDIIETSQQRQMTAVNLLEARLVLTFTKGLPDAAIDDFVADYGIAIIPFDKALSDHAFEAYGRYGKGRHPARLNRGDCAAYALAKARGWPLLYKGSGFSETDIERA